MSVLPRHTHDVVTLGEVLAVFIAPDGSPLGRSDRFQLTVAGAESNVAVGLARLGHDVAFVGRVGDDALGRRALRELRAEGVDVDRVVVDTDRATAVLVRDAPTVGTTEVVYHRAGSAGSALRPADLDLTSIAGARLLHVTGITAAISSSAFEACVLAAETARASGTTVTFDPNVRRRIGTRDGWRTIVETMTPLADVVLVGADDASYVLPDAERTAVATWFHRRGVDTVVWKDGAHGSAEIGAHDDVVEQPAVTVPVVDAVGAGDAFAAGWISGWLDGVDVRTRLLRAATSAASVVANVGDLPGLPDRAALATLLGPTREMNR